MHECKNTCSSCDKIMIKVGNSLVDDTCVRVGVLLTVGVVVLIGIKVGIGITKIATRIYKVKKINISN